MIRAIQNQYAPDFVSPPGETLTEVLESLGMSQAELAERTGRAKKTINEIAKAKAPITPKIALEFESVLGVPASFWNSRESQYREHIARRDEHTKLTKQLTWLALFPVREMIKFGWIAGFEDKVHQLREMLKFFQIGSPEQWENYAKPYTEQVVFRKSDAFESNLPAAIAWLRRGEILARAISCAPYNQGKFRENLRAIRGMTKERPDVFCQKMIELAAAAGVAVVIVPELPKIRISAATRWLSSHKGMIQLSLRYKRNDQFWFSFFHEAGHILLHGKRDIFINAQEDSPEEKENQANAFASGFLIPTPEFRTLTKYGAPSRERVAAFAAELGIAPGIIVGRLQREKVIPYSFYNDLTVKFEWAS
jgi:HTH-type transcriptional regulator / antitoxin HigA